MFVLPPQLKWKFPEKNRYTDFTFWHGLQSLLGYSVNESVMRNLAPQFLIQYSLLNYLIDFFFPLVNQDEENWPCSYVEWEQMPTTSLWVPQSDVQIRPLCPKPHAGFWSAGFGARPWPWTSSPRGKAWLSCSKFCFLWEILALDSFHGSKN